MQKRHRGPGVVLGLSVLLAAACAFPHQRAHDRTCGPIAQRLVKESATGDTLTTPILHWETWDIPEFQDQQRLVAGPPAGNSYGPLACVVARPHIGELKESDFADPEGAMVAMMWVQFDGRVVNASYSRLHVNDLARHFYCVVVKSNSQAGALLAVEVGDAGLTPRGPSTWTGYIVPFVTGKCETIKGKAPLEGMRMTVAGATSAEIPEVARFMTDVNWKAGVGVRCGDAWCEMGFPMADFDAPPHGFASTGSATGNRARIPGWYDDQEIATPGSDAGLSIRSELHASVVPFAAIDGYDVPDFDTWKPVATVYFASAPTAKYASKWGFNSGPNVLTLKRSGWWIFEEWEAEVNGVDRNLRVIRTEHDLPGFHIVGTARWAWWDLDEPIWVRCGQGCCLVEPET